jgi:Tfp pilus assembly PilM family ATPase
MSARRRPTFPLGIDFGRNRIRVALTERRADGTPSLVAVAARETGDDPISALSSAVRELATTERRCVIGIAPPDAVLRIVAVPKMSWFERRKAATLYASRFIDYPISEAAISLVPLDGDGHWTLGIARRAALAVRLNAARQARLRPVAIDDVAFALGRAHDDVDGVIDISAHTTRVIIFAQPIPYVADIPLGAADLTEGIARSLGIDETVAEERMRAIGFGGAGESQRDALIDAIAGVLAGARGAGYTDVRALTTVGNGSRIPGLADAIERGIGYGVRRASFAPSVSDTLPSDVLRAAATDWSVAFGLSVWETAG